MKACTNNLSKSLESLRKENNHITQCGSSFLVNELEKISESIHRESAKIFISVKLVKILANIFLLVNDALLSELSGRITRFK